MDIQKMADLREKLLQKLRGGNKRYPHLNATIRRSISKADVTILNELKKGQSKDFIDKLLKQPNFKFEIPLKDIDKEIIKYSNKSNEIDAEKKKIGIDKLEILASIKKKFSSMESIQKEEFNEFGTKSFAFGYPLLIKQFDTNKDELICAPLFLWYLDITRDFSTNSIIISRNEDNPILFNEMLDNYLLNELNLDFTNLVQSLNDDVFNDGIMDKGELEESVNKIISQISSTLKFVYEKPLISVPKDKKEIQNILVNKKHAETVLNAGIFGIFKAGKQSIITDMKNLLNAELPGPIEEDEILQNLIKYAAVETDPSQNSVLEIINENNNLIIQGPPGTGKSQTLTALITNALTNEQRILVVCEKRTAMEIINENLIENNLGEYVALIENVTKDRGAIVDKARSIHEATSYHYVVKDELEESTKKYLDAKNKITNHHKSIEDVQTKGLGDNKNLLGKFFEASRNIDYESEVFDKHFSKLNFDFTSSEFNLICQDLNDAELQITLLDSLRFVPKENIVNSGQFDEDKNRIISEIEKIKADLESVGRQFLKDRDALIKSKVVTIQSSQKLMIEKTQLLKKIIETGENDFSWVNIYEIISKNFDITAKSLSLSIDKMTRLEKEISVNRARIVKKIDYAIKGIIIIKELISSIQSDIDFLSSNSVDTFKIEIFDNVKSFLSSNAKKIKASKDSIQANLEQLNETIDKYSSIIKSDDIALTNNIKKDLNGLLALLPSKKDLQLHFYSQKIGLGDNNTSLKNMTNFEYLSSIRSSQLIELHKMHSTLFKLLINEFEKMISVNSISEFYQDIIVDNSPSDPLLILDKIINQDVPIKELTDKVTALIDKGLLTHYESINNLKELGLELFSNSIYSGIFNDQAVLLKTTSEVGEFMEFILNNNTELNAYTEAIERDFYSYYVWCSAFCELRDISKKIISIFEIEKTPKTNWKMIFNNYYYKNAFKSGISDSNFNNDLQFERLRVEDTRIKSLINENAKSYWSGERMARIGSVERGYLKFNSLYNKRGAAGQRRNSLRKIIDKDFLLFTALFPIVICNPGSAASLLPLKKNLFDIVLFDEASQLRLEDTYTSLYRGRRKIISGDRHQMPPSNYFQGNPGDDENEYNDDVSMQDQELVNSESLLDYGQNNNYHSEMLRVHYRSSHQDLINFSNSAFYENKLIPLPSLKEYKPIDFHHLEGILIDRTNQIEANHILNILSELILDGDISNSIGVVTLNLPQSELIKDKISKKREDDKDFNEGIVKLEENGFFVKNLENVQGDERDIMILSTTFAPDSEGNFRQLFGPLSRKNSYRLLNVLVTRAKDKFIIVSSIPDKYISKYSEEIKITGNDKKGILYAYLAYAKAVGSDDQITKNAILRLLENTQNEINSFSEGATESPFEEEVLEEIESFIDKDRIKLQYLVGSEKFRIDMVILDKSKNMPMLAIECDGYAYHSSPQAYLYDMYRQKILEKKGFVFYRIWSTNWFYDTKNEREKLINKIQELDALDRVNAN